MKYFKKLRVFGDSFSTPSFMVDPKDSFWGLSASFMGIPEIDNLSRPANNLDSICHAVITNNQKFDWGSDLFFICVPPLERIAVFDFHKDTQFIGKQISTVDWNASDLVCESLHGIISLAHFGKDRRIVAFYERSWTEVNVLRTLFLLTEWLDSKNASYLIMNMSKPLDSNNRWRPSEFILDHMMAHPRCLLFGDTYQSINENVHKPPDFDRYGWNGHHGPEGNKRFFDLLVKPKIEKEIMLL